MILILKILIGVIVLWLIIYAIADSISNVKLMKLILSKKESDSVAATQPKSKDTHKKEDLK